MQRGHDRIILARLLQYRSVRSACLERPSWHNYSGNHCYGDCESGLHHEKQNALLANQTSYREVALGLTRQPNDLRPSGLVEGVSDRLRDLFTFSAVVEADSREDLTCGGGAPGDLELVAYYAWSS